MARDVVEGDRGLFERARGFRVSGIEAAENVREFRKADRGMVATTHFDEIVDGFGGSAPELIDVNGGVDKQWAPIISRSATH